MNAAARELESAHALAAAGRFAEAQAMLLRVLARPPIDPDAAALMCVVSTHLGDPAKAAYWAERSAAAAPDSPLAQVNLIAALSAASMTDRAIAAGGVAMVRFANNPQIGAALALAFMKADRRLEAVTAIETAIERAPDEPKIYANAVPIALNAGRSDLALRWARHALALNPHDADVLYFLIAALNYADAARADEFLPAAMAYDRAMAASLGPARTTWGVSPDPERLLHIGVISGDFRAHPIPMFFRPFLERHDRKSFRITCYSTASYEDSVTEALRANAAAWRRVGNLQPRSLCQRIVDDRVDVLIDLSGHTPGHAMHVLHLKPAPLILTWIGFPASPGLRSIDFRVTDSLCDPPDQPWLGLERPLRIDPCYVPYRPPADAPPLAPSPRLRAGHITFGAISSLLKLTDATLRLWAAVLSRVPDSRLLYKAAQLSDDSLRESVRRRMVAAGIPADRLTVEGPAPGPAATMAEYARIDISLDTFPYHGMTTTCESLWMGVPMIAMRGGFSAARVNCSLLSAVGLGELVADSESQYIQIACALAANHARLESLRSIGPEGLRARTEASPIRDEIGHTRRLEAAIRACWRNWCASRTPS